MGLSRSENDAENERNAARRGRIERALTEHFARRDTNNGKTYCVDCDANERSGVIKHKRDCAVSVALIAFDE